MLESDDDRPLHKKLPPVDLDSSFDPLGRPQVPLWKQRWFQITLAVLAVLAVASYIVPAMFGLLYAVRGVLTPVLVGIALAYIFNPLVTWARHRLKIPRPVSAALLLVGFFGLILAAVPLLLVPMIRQVVELVQNIPTNLQRLSDRDDLPAFLRPLIESANAAIEQARLTLGGEPGEAAEAAADLLQTESAAELAEEAVSDAVAEVNADAGVAADIDPEIEPAVVPTVDGGAVEVLTLTEAETEALIAEQELLVAEALEVAEAADAAFRDEFAARGLEVPGDGGLGEWISNRLSSIDWAEAAQNTMTVLNASADAIGIAVGLATYLTLAAVIITFVFFFTVWKFDNFIQWFAPYVPASRRDRVHALLCKMDRSVSAFIRGRLIQAVVLAFVLTVGLAFTDAAKYALLLGVIGGVLGLIPYAGLIVLPASIILAILAEVDAGKDFSLLWAVIAPAAVFFVAQAIDSYIVEPVVQGKATNLDAITVFLVVCIGGSLAGLLGLLIAIPAAACIKILFAEVVLPRLRRIAEAS